MKVISLNCWGGKGGVEKLSEFFSRHQDIDVFCLQEAWHNDTNNRAEEWGHVGTIVNDIQVCLPDHKLFFHPHWSHWFGLALFVKNNIKVLDVGDVFVYKERFDALDEDGLQNHARNIQFITLETERRAVTVINFHGLWLGPGKGKNDTEARITQSQRIIDFMKTLSTPKILVGDFNILPDTKSIALFEEYGMKNLIREHNILSTRSSIYTKEDKFADYIFTDPSVHVNQFSVLKDEVSDHLPLYIDFE